MSKKNILFLLTDQQRFDHIGSHPDSVLETPNLDRLAEGASFTDCHTVSPLCTPARCALLTGRYAHQVNMRTMSGELDPAYPTCPRALQQAGYHTACIGKTHWWQGWSWFDRRTEAHYDFRGLNEELKRYGFDYVWEAGEKRATQPTARNDLSTYLEDRGYGPEYMAYYSTISGATFRIDAEVKEGAGAFPFPEEDMAEFVVTTKTIEAIDKAMALDQPFFINCSWFAPHDPYDPPQRFLDRVPYEEVDDFVAEPGEPELSPAQKKKLWELRRAYKALVLVIDGQVGRLMDALEERGILDDTVILFTSDHGDLMGDHGWTQKGLPCKQSVNVPAIIRHPDFMDGMRNQKPTEVTDLTATILDIAGLDPQQALAEEWPSYLDLIPSRSLMPVLRGEAERVRDFAFSECDLKWHDREGRAYEQSSWQMVANEQWKYIRYVNRQAREPGKQRREVLIDRTNDPDEVRNRAEDPECSAILEQCRTQLDFILDTTPTAQTNWIPFERRQGHDSLGPDAS